MDALTLINAARAAGLSLYADGNTLRIRGPKSADPLVQKISGHKEAVLQALHELDANRRDAPPAVLFDVGSVFRPHKGVEHRCVGCRCRNWWEHIFGGYYCLDCFPPTLESYVARREEPSPSKPR